VGQTPIVSILCVLGASLLGAVGPYLFKAGADRAGAGAFGAFASPWVWAGMACYLLVMSLFTYAFRRGGTVTVLYPLYATTFVWAAVLGALLVGQPIRPVHVLGMVLLLAGVGCLTVGNAAGPEAARPGAPASER
jgi:drug/metabolite transporter (DMT)-like permease